MASPRGPRKPDIQAARGGSRLALVEVLSTGLLPALRWAWLLRAGGQAKSAVLGELRARKVEVIVEGMDAVPKPRR